MIAIKLTEFDLELNVFVILRLEIILALGILASDIIHRTFWQRDVMPL